MYGLSFDNLSGKVDQLQIEDLVVVIGVIGPNWRVSQSMFLQSHPVFEQAVRDAITGWRYVSHVAVGHPMTVFTVFWIYVWVDLIQ